MWKTLTRDSNYSTSAVALLKVEAKASQHSNIPALNCIQQPHSEANERILEMIGHSFSRGYLQNTDLVQPPRFIDEEMESHFIDEEIDEEQNFLKIIQLVVEAELKPRFYTDHGQFEMI